MNAHTPDSLNTDPVLADKANDQPAPATAEADNALQAQVATALHNAGLTSEVLAALQQRAMRKRDAAPAQRHRPGFALLALWLAVGAVVGGIVEYKFNLFGLLRGDTPASPAAALAPVESSPQPDPTQLNLFDTSEALAAAIEFASQSVVSITAERSSVGPRHRDTLIQSQGSGVFVRVDNDTAYAVTNSHVVNGFPAIWINWRDYTVEARRVGIDPATDLAVIAVRLADLPVRPTACVFADSELVRQGHLVVAIGTPSGYRNSASLGIISALDRGGDPRTLYGYADDLQTSAPINKGSSGGPLVDIRGRVVGINTWKVENSEGLGFAIPSYLVQRVARDLIAEGEVRRAALGILPKEMNEVGIAQALGPGVWVDYVAPDTPAAKAGLQPHDIIRSIDDVPIRTVLKLKTLIAHHYPGDHINIVICRGGVEMTISVMLGLAQ